VFLRSQPRRHPKGAGPSVAFTKRPNFACIGAIRKCLQGRSKMLMRDVFAAANLLDAVSNIFVDRQRLSK